MLRLGPVGKHDDLPSNNGPNLRKWQSGIADNESNPWHGPLTGYTTGKLAQVLLGMALENHRRLLKENSSYQGSSELVSIGP
jgi:hypothetical protein